MSLLNTRHYKVKVEQFGETVATHFYTAVL